MKISVIVPVYNKERYLKKILFQIAEQSFESFECILVDDGSTDESGKICDEFAEAHKRFRIFHILNGGAAHARNVALDYALGEYITFIDADDEIHIDYLKNLYECIVFSKADIVIGSLKKIWDERNEYEVVRYQQVNQILNKNEVLLSFARIQEKTGVFGYCTCKIFLREKLKDIRFDEKLKLAEDFEFYLRLYANIETFYFDDKPFYYYRQEAENSTAIMEDGDIDYYAQLNINLRYRDFLKKEKVYINDNKKIVEEKINSYVYFSMFYCPVQHMDARFAELYHLCNEFSINLVGKGTLQKVLLKLLKYKKLKLVKSMILIYRFFRSLKNGKRK